jgi:hypothetical protein
MAGGNDSGVTGAVAELPILMTIVAFMTISLYNIIELNVIIFATFKKRSGLYFWSFIVATWGIAPHTIGFVLKFFNITATNYLPVTLVAFGWVGMVTGQSSVLYSRLHLVAQNANWIRWVLYMIIFNAVVLHIPVIVLAYGANSANPTPFLKTFAIYDRVQIAVFFVQETIISFLYIYKTIQLLGPGGEVKRKPLRQLLVHLILVNILILIFDVALLTFQFSGQYAIQTTFKSTVYSIKLKIEFSVLNRLVNILQQTKDLSLGNISNDSDPNNMADHGGSVNAKTSRTANHGGFVNTDNPPLRKDSFQPRARTSEWVMQSDESGNWNNSPTVEGGSEKN